MPIFKLHTAIKNTLASMSINIDAVCNAVDGEFKQLGVAKNTMATRTSKISEKGPKGKKTEVYTISDGGTIQYKTERVTMPLRFENWCNRMHDILLDYHLDSQPIPEFFHHWLNKFVVEQKEQEQEQQ